MRSLKNNGKLIVALYFKKVNINISYYNKARAEFDSESSPPDEKRAPPEKAVLCRDESLGAERGQGTGISHSEYLHALRPAKKELTRETLALV
jgi:hypothetical protein